MSTEGTLEVYLSAGLGNRLFQYASVKGLAKKYKCEFKIFALDYNHEHNFNNYQWFLQKILPQNGQCLQIPRHLINSQELKQQLPHIKIWNQPDGTHLGYHEPNKDEIKNCVLVGYFQSEQYFENIADELREQFKEPTSITPHLNNYLINLRTSIKDCCILHVRLKDKLFDPRHFVHYGKYYERAINQTREKNPSTFFLVMCETPEQISQIYPTLLQQLGQEDIDYRFVPNKPTRAEDMSIPSDLFDFYLITRIPTIISTCSTFVWWATWLNPLPFPEKQLYLPSHFLNDPINHRVDMKGAYIIDVA